MWDLDPRNLGLWKGILLGHGFSWKKSSSPLWSSVLERAQLARQCGPTGGGAAERLCRRPRLCKIAAPRTAGTLTWDVADCCLRLVPFKIVYFMGLCI